MKAAKGLTPAQEHVLTDMLEVTRRVEVAEVMSRERQIEVADWIVETCLVFGTSVHTAYHVAGLFIEALEQENAPPAPEGERR